MEGGIRRVGAGGTEELSAGEPQRRLRPDVRRAVRALAVDRVTAEVFDELQAAGIRPILLKGPSIARWLYPTGGRSYRDTDVLVSPDAFLQAAAVLERLGFVNLQGQWPEGERPDRETARVYLRHPGSGVPGAVDLHRSLPHLTVPDNHLWETLDARTDILVLGGRAVRVLDITARAAHIVFHAVQHGHGHHTGEDLRRLLGVLTLDQWRDVAELAAALDHEGVLAVGLRLDPAGAQVADLLGLPDMAVQESSSWRSFAPRGAWRLAAFRGQSTLRWKLRQIRWVLLPSRPKVRYIAGRSHRHPQALAAEYLRWWWGLARAALPALRFVATRHRVLAGVEKEKGEPGGSRRWSSPASRRRKSTEEPAAR